MDLTQTVPGFSSTPPRLSGLGGKHVAFGEVTEGVNNVETIERVGPRNGKTARSSPLLTVDNCNKFF